MTPEGRNKGSLQKKTIVVFKPSRQQNTTQPSLNPPWWDGDDDWKKGKTHGLRQRQFTRTEKEGKIIRIMIKEYTKQVIHKAIAYHSLSNIQSVPKQHSPSPG